MQGTHTCRWALTSRPRTRSQCPAVGPDRCGWGPGEDKRVDALVQKAPGAGFIRWTGSQCALRREVWHRPGPREAAISSGQAPPAQDAVLRKVTGSRRLHRASLSQTDGFIFLGSTPWGLGVLCAARQPIHHGVLRFEDHSFSFAASSSTCLGASRGRHRAAVGSHPASSPWQPAGEAGNPARGHPPAGCELPP